jgi:hypothetical protein
MTVWVDYDDGHAGGYPHWCTQPTMRSLGHTFAGVVYSEHVDPITGEHTADYYEKCSCGQRGGWAHTAEVLGAFIDDDEVETTD